MKPFGTGSALQLGISAVTAAVQGLSGGNLAQAVSGAAAPYVAEKIHELTTDAKGKVNTEANLMAHAVLGAVTSYAAGNAALAGASGAAMGEYIAQQLYPGVKRADLSEEQRQTISALGTLAAGLAGGVVGDSTADAVAGAQAGKTSLENNALGNDDDELQREHGNRPVKVIPINPMKTGVLDDAGNVKGAGGIIGGGKGSTKPANTAKESVRFIEGVTVKDIKTGQTFSGTVDLKPTLDRIASGGTNPHRNDGSVFKNLPDRTTGKSGFPPQPTGYYKEYVHPTPNISGPGPQRVIVGQNGEAYYTNDHYKTFIKIRE